MHTDPISDLLTRIRNAINAGHETATVPYSKIKMGILAVIKAKGFITDFKEVKVGNHPEIEITLNEEMHKITLKRVSKPGQRIYVKKEDLKTIKSGLGFTIISTSKGVMEGAEAKKQRLGGELICEIY